MPPIPPKIKREIEALHASPEEALVAFALTTFQTSAFVLLIIALLYRGGSLGETLGGFSTEAGTLFFAYFWLTDFWCTWKAVQALGLSDLVQGDAGRVLLQGMKWGGANGLLFFLPLVLGFALVGAGLAAFDGRWEVVPSILVFSLPIALVGGFVAFLVGMTVGFAFAVMEALLLVLSLGLVLPRIVGDEPVSESAGTFGSPPTA